MLYDSSRFDELPHVIVLLICTDFKLVLVETSSNLDKYKSYIISYESYKSRKIIDTCLPNINDIFFLPLRHLPDNQSTTDIPTTKLISNETQHPKTGYLEFKLLHNAKFGILFTS